MNKGKVINKPLEARKASPLLVSVSAVILGMLAGCILILVIGKNPITGYSKLFMGALSNKRKIGATIGLSTQLIFAGLSFSFAYKTGLFNIGGSGQMLVGGITCSLLAHMLPAGIPRPIYLVIIILAAILAGGLWGFISGFLKAKFNVHEVVSCIMLNWIAYWICYDFIPRFIIDPSIAVKSAPIANERTLRSGIFTALFGKTTTANLGFLLAIAAVVLIWFILNKTTLGFNLKAVGANRYCAEYAGIKVTKSIIISMAISGALCGLAGLSFYCGYSNIMEMGKMPSEGFDGIAVSLLGNATPVGSLVAGLFFGVLKNGKLSLAAIGIPTELADTIIAIIIYFAATNVLFRNFWDGRFKKSFERQEEYFSLAVKGEKTMDQVTPEERKALIKQGKELAKAKKEVK
ncbi:MAG: ABC transporter permease [Bullifex sp.]|nr:ABC transporter permease [Spirochaetales bacterium]MDY2816199.1 ABC transporter permease [Bullifex sp.]MDD7535467.1 ABC transporter permease [Spirochaetales bacterium]MDY3850161.1 ABC transporter permease [Bullifex sp.]MDY4799812.1 ABC transporter permease [Bullifex sp.]